MNEVTIRQITGDEYLDVLYPKMNYAFRSSPPLSDEEEWRKRMGALRGGTSFAVFEDDVPQACASSTAMTQNIRGKLFPMGGIWGVATDPIARRKGYAKQILTRLLGAIHENGQPVSGLYPFRESFYQKLGYITFPQVRIAKINPADLAPVMRIDLPGHVERVIGTDGFHEYKKFLHKVRAGTHGMALIDQSPDENPGRGKIWIAFARVDGEIWGAMVYRLIGDELNFNMKISRYHSINTEGRYLLLDWIARHVDQASKAEISLPPFEFPETWLADMNVHYGTQSPTPMGRVIDIAHLGGMQVGPGGFTAQISDPICPWNDGIWQFTNDDGKLQISAAQQADCSLTIQGLSALVYGTHDPAVFGLRGWGDPSPDAQASMRSLFPPRLPFIYEQF